MNRLSALTYCRQSGSFFVRSASGLHAEKGLFSRSPYPPVPISGTRRGDMPLDARPDSDPSPRTGTILCPVRPDFLDRLSQTLRLFVLRAAVLDLTRDNGDHSRCGERISQSDAVIIHSGAASGAWNTDQYSKLPRLSVREEFPYGRRCRQSCRLTGKPGNNPEVPVKSGLRIDSPGPACDEMFLPRTYRFTRSPGSRSFHQVVSTDCSSDPTGSSSEKLLRIYVRFEPGRRLTIWYGRRLPESLISPH